MPHPHRHLPSIMLHRHLMVFIMPLLEVGILKVMSDLSNNTKYRTTDRAFQDHNTLPTPLHLALHLVFHLSSTMLPHHRHLMLFVMPQLEVGILKVMSEMSDTKYRTTDRAFKDHKTLPTPCCLALHLVLHLSSIMPH